jgi:hypothetical protein
MKIETIVKNYAGQTIKFSDGIKVTFDANCLADVTPEIGTRLIEKYTGQIFLQGKVVQPMVRTSTVPPEITGKESSMVGELREKLQRANFLLNDFKAQLNAAQQNERVWRMKCEELMQTTKAIPTKNTNTIPAENKKVENALTEAEALKTQLTAKTVKELQKIAEELNLSADEYLKLSKINLVNFLIEKTTANGDS